MGSAPSAQNNSAAASQELIRKQSAATARRRKDLQRIGRYPYASPPNFIMRLDKETVVKDAIRQLLASTKRSDVFLHVVGKEGAGKSVLLANLLFESSFIYQECLNVESILWLNIDDIIASDQDKGQQPRFRVSLSPHSDFLDVAIKEIGKWVPIGSSKSGEKLLLVVLDFGKYDVPDRLKKALFQRSVRLITISRQFQSEVLEISFPSNKASDGNSLVFVEDLGEAIKNPSLRPHLEKVVPFLLFKPGDPVEAADLAILRDGAEGEADLDELCRCGIVQEMRTVQHLKGQPLNETSPMKRDFVMSERIHHALFEAFNESHLEKLVNERGKQILLSALQQKRGLLVQAIAASSFSDFQEDVITCLCSKDCLLSVHNLGNYLNEFDNLTFYDGVLSILDKIDPNLLEPILKRNSPKELLLASAALGLKQLARIVLFKADVNLLDDTYTPLMLAALNGNDRMCLLLLKNGADVSLGNESLMTPIYLAAQKGLLECVELLLEAGADPTCRIVNPDFYRQFGEDDSPLITASKYGRTSVVRVLLDNKRVKVVDDKGRAALLLAVRFGHEEVVEILLENGYDPNSATVDRGDSALMFATNRCREDIVKMLLDKGAKPGLQSKDGKTAMSWAMFQGRPDIARMFAGDSKNDAAITEATLFQMINDRDLAGLQGMFQGEPKADPNSCMNGVVTPLNSAVEQGLFRIVGLLLQNGANPNLAANARRITALMKAVDYENIAMIRVLLSNGADVNVASCEVGTPLVYAALNDSVKMVNVLLEAGADPNVRHVRDLDTVLMIAVRNGNEGIVRALLKKGAQVDATANGMTALEIAEKRNLDRIIDLLRFVLDKRGIRRYVFDGER